jgi:hypothetical protein
MDKIPVFVGKTPCDFVDIEAMDFLSLVSNLTILELVKDGLQKTTTEQQPSISSRQFRS